MSRDNDIQKELESHTYQQHDVTCDADCISCPRCCDCDLCQRLTAELNGILDERKRIMDLCVSLGSQGKSLMDLYNELGGL
jgi:hypothetical protein